MPNPQIRPAGKSGDTPVLSVVERIAASRRASAVERAWDVAKALEDTHQLAGLRWVSPVTDGKQGIARRIDFEAEFPPGVSALMPLPMDIGIIAPANRVVPGEGIHVSWTMPILIRTRPAKPLDVAVTDVIPKCKAKLHVRPTIEVVTFLPFPRVDAPQEETFQTEFLVTLKIGQKHLGSGDRYFGAVVRFGDKVVSQMVNGSDRTSVLVFADPFYQTLFKAEMLVGLSEAELNKTTENAGTLDIYVYRVAKAKREQFGGLSSLREPSMRGSGFELVEGLGQKPVLPTPAAASKEVGDTRVGEGTAGEAVVYGSFEALVDTDFPVQHLSIRCLGVREGSRDATVRMLNEIAGQ